MKAALITGASSGIGYELAKIVAQKGNNLLLIARTEEKLRQIKEDFEQTYSISVFVFVADLSDLNASRLLYDFTQENSIEISYLINNAGFGDFGYFHESNWERTNEMIQLNITSLTHLTRLFLPAMVKKGEGKILNIASTAAFQPGPMMAVYFSTKAYVLHFSEAVAAEVKESGVSVTTLCPGPTESNFKFAANMENGKLFKGKGIPKASDVAQYAYKAMMKGKVVAIHGWKNKFLIFSERFVPRSWVVKIVSLMQN